MCQGGSSLSTSDRQTDGQTDSVTLSSVCLSAVVRRSVPTWLDVCSLLGRVVFNYYECRRRHVTSSYLTRRICRRRRRRRRRGRPAVGGRRFADGSCYSGCTRCHGNDCRERRPAFVGQLSRSRAGLLECIHDTDLPHTHTRIHIIRAGSWYLGPLAGLDTIMGRISYFITSSLCDQLLRLAVFLATVDSHHVLSLYVV